MVAALPSLEPHAPVQLLNLIPTPVIVMGMDGVSPHCLAYASQLRGFGVILMLATKSDDVELNPGPLAVHMPRYMIVLVPVKRCVRAPRPLHCGAAVLLVEARRARVTA